VPNYFALFSGFRLTHFWHGICTDNNSIFFQEYSTLCR
jgi:hypothetical protein